MAKVISSRSAVTIAVACLQQTQAAESSSQPWSSLRLIGDAEHFSQKRYYNLNIRNYPQFVEKLRYIHRNPVK